MPAARHFPPVDAHIVEPLSGYEVVRGKLLLTPAALEPHAQLQVDLGALIRTHVAPGYVAAIELLTRVNERSNFATDLCIRREGVDEHGSRHLEELSFEVVYAQRPGNIRARAEDLSERGVRRVIAISLKRREVAEWLPEQRRWQTFRNDELLDDPTLIRPIPIRAMLDGRLALDEIVDGLDANGNPRLREFEAAARNAGERALLQRQLEHRFGPLPDELRDRLAHADAEQLEAWSLRLLDARSIDDALA